MTPSYSSSLHLAYKIYRCKKYCLSYTYTVQTKDNGNKIQFNRNELLQLNIYTDLKFMDLVWHFLLTTSTHERLPKFQKPIPKHQAGNQPQEKCLVVTGNHAIIFSNSWWEGQGITSPKNFHGSKPLHQNYVLAHVLHRRVLTAEKNWQQWQIQEYNDAGVAETEVVDLLCTITSHVIIHASDNNQHE